MEQPAMLRNSILSKLHGPVFILMQQRQQCLGESRQVPACNAGLIPIGIPAVDIDGTEYCIRIIGVHKCTRSIIYGFTTQSHVVCIHHPMDEAHQLPFCYKLRLPPDNLLQKGGDIGFRCPPRHL